MKKILVLGMAAFLVFGFVSGASAGITDPLPFSYPTEVRFITHIDASVTSANIGLYSTVSTGTLEFQVGAGAWIPYDSTYADPARSWNIPVIDGGIVGLRISSPTTSAVSMTFVGPNVAGYPGHYDAIAVNWGSNSGTTVLNTNGGANLSPVPLPGAVWFLGIGLVGLVGIRRRGSI